MHELSLAESVIALAEKAAAEAGAARILRIRLALGEMAHVDPDTLIYCCGLVAREGPAAAADYVVDRIAAEGWCANCLKTVKPDAAGRCCPLCGGSALELRAGDEMRIIDIAVA
jgi:hydrogenase nickel incorporation protein HypA/HybF